MRSRVNARNTFPFPVSHHPSGKRTQRAYPATAISVTPALPDTRSGSGFSNSKQPMGWSGDAAAWGVGVPTWAVGT